MAPLVALVVSVFVSGSSVNGEQHAHFGSTYLQGDVLQVASLEYEDVRPSIAVRSIRLGEEPHGLAPMNGSLHFSFGVDHTSQAFPRSITLARSYAWVITPVGSVIAQSSFAPSRYSILRVPFGGLLHGNDESDVAIVARCRGAWNDLPELPSRPHAPHSWREAGGDYLFVAGGIGDLGDAFRSSRSIDEDGTSGETCGAVVLRPVSEYCVRLYAILCPSKVQLAHWPSRIHTRMFVLEYRFGKGAPKEKPEQPRPRELLFDSPLKHQWIGEWTPIDSYEIDFFRPFAGVFANGADYFVSDDGRVFRSPATTAGPNRRANELTLRDGELVQALIYDHDRGNAAFAFTSKYWFEVQEPIEYREFELGVLKADDPLPTLVRAAREVRKFYPAIPQVEPRKPDPPQADPVNTDAPPAGPSNGAPAPQ